MSRWHLEAGIACEHAIAPSIQKTDWDRMYDFSTVKTFAVKLGTSWGNPLSENRVSADLADTLKAKGWQPAPEAMADAVVVFGGDTGVTGAGACSGSE